MSHEVRPRLGGLRRLWRRVGRRQSRQIISPTFTPPRLEAARARDGVDNLLRADVPVLMRTSRTGDRHKPIDSCYQRTLAGRIP